MSENISNTKGTAILSGQKPAWGAIWAMSLGVFSLVTAEFLPASLLTPIAADLHITEGMAGQTVTITAVFAFIFGLIISPITRNFDRRPLMIFLAASVIFSNLMVALAPNMLILLIGRVALGVALGGIWSMSAAIAARLVSPEQLPKALSIIFSGVSAAIVVAAPLGSYLGDMFGWRFVFWAAAGLGALALISQAATLPKLPPSGTGSLRTIPEVLKRSGVAWGVTMMILVWAGHFIFFTYIRVFLESVTGVGIDTFSGILLGFGIANIIGTALASMMINRSLKFTMFVMPLLMGLLAIALVTFGQFTVAAAVLISVWGIGFGVVPVSWSTWLTRTLPDRAEAAGGLFVAAAQLATAVGAVVGGTVYDMVDAKGVFIASAVVLLAAAAGIALKLKSPATA